MNSKYAHSPCLVCDLGHLTSLVFCCVGKIKYKLYSCSCVRREWYISNCSRSHLLLDPIEWWMHASGGWRPKYDLYYWQSCFENHLWSMAKWDCEHFIPWTTLDNYRFSLPGAVPLSQDRQQTGTRGIEYRVASKDATAELSMLSFFCKDY